MNRITQCMFGSGTVSGLMHHRSRPLGEVPGKYLAFAGSGRPVVFWNLTDRCNLSCTHCYASSAPGRDTSGELDTTEAIALIDDFARMGVPLVLLSGGEPLLRHDLWELAGHLHDRGIKTALSTNGTLIDGSAARKIRESGIEYAGISLDGATAATHDRFRNSSGAFERTLAAFGHCRDAGVRCGVRITLNRENAAELEGLVDLSRSVGASRFCLYWLVPCGRGGEQYEHLQLDPAQAVSALELLERKAAEAGPEAMEFLTVDAPQDAIHLLETMEREASPDLPAARALAASLGGGCSAGSRVANIDPRGNVYPCQFGRSPEFLVGSVRDRPFSTLWADASNPVLARFRKNPRELTGSCGICDHRGLCGGGCRIRAFHAYGDHTADDPFCFLRRTESPRQGTLRAPGGGITP